MYDGHWALLMCILRDDVTPDQAFAYIETGTMPASRGTITEADILDMIDLRNKGMSYREIGELYGVRDSAVCRRIRGYISKGREYGAKE